MFVVKLILLLPVTLLLLILIAITSFAATLATCLTLVAYKMYLMIFGEDTKNYVRNRFQKYAEYVEYIHS